MADPLMLAQYHDAVLTSLKHIAWVKEADTYPEKNVPHYSGLVTPAVWFTLNSWEQAGGHEGQLKVELCCDLFVIVDAATSGLSKPEIFLRSAAADLTQWIDGQQFGLAHAEPAIFTAAERDEFDPRLDDYLVWRVSYLQTAAFGCDLLAPTGNPLNQIWLGCSPETGEAHVQEYRLIYEAQHE